MSGRIFLTSIIQALVMLSCFVIVRSLLFDAPKCIDAVTSLQLRMAMPMLIAFAILSLKILFSKNKWKAVREIIFLTGFIIGLLGISQLMSMLFGEPSELSLIWALITTIGGLGIAFLLNNDSRNNNP